MDIGVSHLDPPSRLLPQPRLSGVMDMSKGLDKKREEKRKPAKNLKEKRAEKKVKKEGKSHLA